VVTPVQDNGQFLTTILFGSGHSLCDIQFLYPLHLPPKAVCSSVHKNVGGTVGGTMLLAASAFQAEMLKHCLARL